MGNKIVYPGRRSRQQQQQPASPTSMNSGSPCSSVIPQRRSCAPLMRPNRRARMATGFLGGVEEMHSPAEGRHSFADDEPLRSPGTTSVGGRCYAEQPEEETLPSGAVTLCTKVEYTSLPREAEHTVFGLVSLQAAEATEQAGASTTTHGEAAPTGSKAPDQQEQQDTTERSPIDLVCVLDVSGSMGGEKIALLKQAVRFVVDELGEKDRLSLVVFNQTGRRLTPLTCMTAEGKDAAHQAAIRLAAGGGTSIVSGMDCGMSVLEQRRQNNAVSAVFMLTDGQDYSTRGREDALAARCRNSAGASLYVFGFGQDHDAALLSAIAEASKTPFTFAEEPEAIKEAFAGAIGGLMSVAAQNLRVRIEVVQPGASLVKVHTSFTTEPLQDLGGEEGEALLKKGALVQIPDLFAGERKDLLLELKVPELPAGGAAGGGTETTELLKARVRYCDLAQKATVETSFVALELERRAAGEEEEQPEMEPDEEVADQRERVEVTNALELCIAECERGNFSQAQEMIKGRQRRLEETCARRKSKGRTPMLEALAGELEDAERRVSSSSAWAAGGLAEISDAVTMHRRQRVTTGWVNASVGLGFGDDSDDDDCERGAKLRASKAKSKGMYLLSTQASKVSKSRFP